LNFKGFAECKAFEPNSPELIKYPVRIEMQARAMGDSAVPLKIQHWFDRCRELFTVAASQKNKRNDYTIEKQID
jgi:hypothetical protein